MAGTDVASLVAEGWARVPEPAGRSAIRVAVVVASLSLAGVLAACGSTAPPGWTVAPEQSPAEQSPAEQSPAVATGFACPPATNPDTPGPVDQVRPPWASPTSMAFDRRAGRLVAVTGPGDGLETWTFDVCTNTWARMHPNREPDGLAVWDPLVYDVDSDVTIAVDRDGSNVWAYDLQADTWTEKGAAPPAATLWDYDPVSGLVIAEVGSDPTELSAYDVETDTWTRIQQAGEPGGGVVAYDASVDRLVAYGGWIGSETWLFDIRTGMWSRSGSETPGVVAGMVGPTIEYDEAAKRTVVIGNIGLAAYDATADRWEVLAELAETDPGPGQFPRQMAYDAVNGRLVGAVDLGGIVAFEPLTREWTVLLEPGAGQPTSP